MGLDTVELVIETELTFGIVINDRDAEQITTMGGLFQYVLTKLKEQTPISTSCQSASVFYRLRRALVQTCGIERDQVRLTTAVGDLISAGRRRSAWSQFQRSLEMRLPRFAPPPWVDSAYPLAILSLVMIPFAAAARDLHIPTAIVLFSIAACTLVLIATAWPLVTPLPEECRSVRSLVLSVIELNIWRFPPADAQWTERKVWDDLCRLVSEQTGVAVGELTEATRFVDDLGMD